MAYFGADDDKKHIDLELNLKVLHYLGVIPPPDIHGFGESKMYQNYTLVSKVVLASCIIAQLVDVFRCWDDIESLSVNISSILGFAICLYKYRKTVEMRHVIHDLLERLDRIFIVYIGQSGDSVHILEDSEWHAKAVTIGFLGLGGIAVTMWCFLRPLQYLSNLVIHTDKATEFSNGCHNRNLPINAWVPFDTTISPYYEIAYIYFTVAYLYSYLVSASLDVFYVSVIIHICGELKLLQYSLTHITDRATRIADEKRKTNQHLPLPVLLTTAAENLEKGLYEEEEIIGSIEDVINAMNLEALPPTPPKSSDATIKIIDGEETLHRRGRVWEFLVSKETEDKEVLLLNMEMYRSLIRCIEHHQELLRFTEDLEDAMNYVMIVQFIGSMIIICMALYQVTLATNETGQLMKYIFNLASMTVQVLLYCWYGQDLIEQSTGVQVAAYECAWLDAINIFKTSVRVIIMRAQKPLLLTAGKFYVISLHSFLVILEASISFFAVLRHVTIRNTGNDAAAEANLDMS